MARDRCESCYGIKPDPGPDPASQAASIMRSGTFASRWAFGVRMIEFISRDAGASGIARIGGQPIALAAAALVVLLVGVGSIVLWRAYTGTSPGQDRITSSRQLQARTAQASEQLVEKTKGLEASQQESIDQLQVVQDQLLTVKRLLTAQQNDTKRLSAQVGSLTEAIEGLRQSFANAQASEPAAEPTGKRSAKAKPHASAHRKRGKSHS